LRVDFKVFSSQSTRNGWLKMIVLGLNPMVKGRKTESPVLAHTDAGNTLLSRQTLQSFDMNAKVICGFLCGQ